MITSLHVIFGLGPPIKNPGCAYAAGACRAVPPKSLLVPSEREQIFVLAQEDHRTFAQKQVATNAFFL